MSLDSLAETIVALQKITLPFLSVATMLAFAAALLTKSSSKRSNYLIVAAILAFGQITFELDIIKAALP